MASWSAEVSRIRARPDRPTEPVEGLSDDAPSFPRAGEIGGGAEALRSGQRLGKPLEGPTNAIGRPADQEYARAGLQKVAGENEPEAAGTPGDDDTPPMPERWAGPVALGVHDLEFSVGPGWQSREPQRLMTRLLGCHTLPRVCRAIVSGSANLGAFQRWIVFAFGNTKRYCGFMKIDSLNRAVDRPLWRELLEREWRERRVIWLTGPRRLGKTTLVRSLPDTDYFDCDLPRVRRDVEDIEGFLKRHRGRRIALDEIHRLADPSNLLKVAADHFPDIHVVATGSSTLGASARFRDTLAGRKRTVRLLPVLHREIAAFHVPTVERRLLHGGLPEHLTTSVLPERDFAEWIEAFWARDILELFSVGKRYSFLRFLELLWAQSGGMCELTGFTAACEASRQTLANYLDIFAATGVVYVLRPFATHPSREIVSMPKVYAFDTGFVCHVRSVDTLRTSDKGGLFEHLVLDELCFEVGAESLHYWRDKQKHEIDFVWTPRGRPPVAIECKWRAAGFDPVAMQVFAGLHPEAAFWLIAEDRDSWTMRRYGSIDVIECGPAHLPELIARHRRR